MQEPPPLFPPPPALLTVVSQHAEEAAALANQRSVLIGAPHVRLHHLRRLDNRLAANLDGLAIAGEQGWGCCAAALANPGASEIFVATVRALEDRDLVRLEHLLALTDAVPLFRPGQLGAFGWVSAHVLEGTIRQLLTSANPARRQVGIGACAMHQVDPGVAIEAALVDEYVSLRARALRAAGESGRRDRLDVCTAAISDEDVACRCWAARSAVLLGDRNKAIDLLRAIALEAGPARALALRMAFKLVDAVAANALLKELAQAPTTMRLLIQGVANAGDPQYVPWLIGQMGDVKMARLAGESFSFITGLDLAYLDLDTKPPKNVESGPNDNPDDDNVAMDEDDGLPWPDAVKLQAWWDGNHQRFEPGVRYFMGERVTVEHCKQVLRDGFQRQRVAAAEYLCLLTPGTPLFPTSAPAWRQQRWLRQMG